MDGPISPLEIPHIVDLIAQYLRKRDLYACTLVSKAFYEEFRRLYWQHIRIGYDSDDSEDSMITHIPESPSFLKNGHFIRKLDIIEGRPGNLLKLLTSPLSPCTNLLELEHVAEEPYEHGSPHILLANLVKRNTRLRRLRVILEEDGVEAKICSALIDVLSKHPSLTDLDLSVTQYFHFYGYEEDFLQNLPKNLETLRLDYVNGSDEARYEEFEEEDEGDEDNDDSKSDDDDNNDNDASSSWRHIVYPSLKSITLTSGIGKSEAATLFQFIRKCSTLESLRLMDIPESLTGEFIKLIGNARKLPNLKDLHFETPVLTMSDWTQLLKSMRERIKSFSIRRVHLFPTTSSFIQAMAVQWADSLETLRFWKHIGLSSMDIELILATCSKLKTFTVSNDVGPYNRQKIGYGQALDIWKRDGVYIDWVCKDLENLEMTFMCNPDPTVVDEDDHATLETSPEDHRRITKGIESTYKRLAQLTKLQRLRIGWHTRPRVNDKQTLDLSIESGLKHLEGLKSLRVLDIRNLYNVNIGQEEVEWIAENWPNLQEIRNLYGKSVRDLFGMVNGLDDMKYSSSMTIVSVDELPHHPKLPHVEWLKRRRPNILVS